MMNVRTRIFLCILWQATRSVNSSYHMDIKIISLFNVTSSMANKD
jgi:hypothetical protein